MEVGRHYRNSITKHHHVFLNYVPIFFFAFFNFLPRKPLEEKANGLRGYLRHSSNILSCYCLLLALQFTAQALKHEDVNENQ